MLRPETKRFRITNLKSAMRNLFAMRLFFFVLSFSLLLPLEAQTPVYLMFDWSCVDILEYRTNSGNRISGYNFRPSSDEQYLFIAGSDYITSNYLPNGTISCRDFTLGETVVDAVNRRTRQVYVVQPASSGYNLIPFVSATHVRRTGSIYKFYTTDCAFAVDTTNLRHNQNLVLAGDTYVYFTGYKIRDCRLQYSFEREPGRANPVRADWEYIPGLGMVTDRSGTTHAEMEGRSLRLTKVNEQSLDDYLTAGCQTRPLLRNTLSRWSGAPLPEPNRETYPGTTSPEDLRPDMRSTPGGNPTPTFATQPSTGPCAQAPEPGYHLVQRGETLNSIARAYGVDVRALISVNKIKQADRLEVCQRLIIPAPKSPAATQGSVAPPAKLNGPDYRPYTETPAPVQHNTTYNNPTPEPAASTTPQQIHIVQPGEYLYQIAKMHGLTEIQIRKYNGFPTIGQVMLYPGNQLWLVDPNSVYQNYQPSQGNQAPKPVEHNTPNPNNDPYRYVFEETPATGEPYIRQYDPKAVPVQDAAVEPIDPNRPYQYGYNQQVSSNTRKPTHYQEYIVISGDTMGSISGQYRITTAELAAANERNPNEALIPGQRLLIPKFGKQ